MGAGLLTGMAIPEGSGLVAVPGVELSGESLDDVVITVIDNKAYCSDVDRFL